MNRTTLMGLLATAAMILGIVTMTGTPADAAKLRHTITPSITCAGATLHAENYDASQANTYDLQVVGVEHLSGTFGAGTDQAISIPQDGKVYAWSYDVSDPAGAYHFADSGKVGPCGTVTPPVTHPKKAWVHFVRYCNAVKIEGRHAIAAVRSDHKGGVWRFFVVAKAGHVFKNGTKFLGRSIHVKRTGCGDVSGY